MAVKPTISNVAAKTALDALLALLDAGAGAGKVQIYDGEQPANPDVAVTTQTKLAELTLNDPAFGAAADADPGAIATANAITDDSDADASGTAAWFRAVDSDGTAVIDGSCGLAAADMILDSLSITAGQTVKINSWTVTMPESAA